MCNAKNTKKKQNRIMYFQDGMEGSMFCRLGMEEGGKGECFLVRDGRLLTLFFDILA